MGIFNGKIKVRRGAAASIPTLAEGEIGFSTDGKDIYVGSNAGNKRFPNAEKVVSSVHYNSDTNQIVQTIDGTDYNVLDMSEIAEAEYPGVYNSYLTKKASGDIVHIEDGAEDVPLKELEFSIEPVQDLHGQASPYPENGGKNKLPLTVSSLHAANTSGSWSGNAYTHRGVTFTLLFDNGGNVSGINVNGTASGGVAAFNLANKDYIASHFTTGGSYILSGRPSGGVAGLQYTSNVNIAYDDAGSGVTCSIMDPETYPNQQIRIYISSGNTITNAVYYPMFRAATEADATFAPYSNYCPILGYTGAKIPVTGKNLFNENAKDAGQGYSNAQYLKSDGTTGNESLYYISEYILISPNTIYTLSGLAGNSPSLCWYDENKTFISGVTYGGNATKTVTSPINAKYVRMSVWKANASILQLEIGSTDTIYEPYNGTVYSLTWADEAGTIYKGSAEYKGAGKWEITADNPDTSYIELDGTESWSLVGDGTRQRRFISATVALLGLPDADITDIEHTQFCSQAVALSNNYGEWGKFRVVTVIVFNDANSHFADAAAFTAYLAAQKTAGTPVAISYKVATPLTFEVSGPDPATLLGLNNIFSNTGDITELTYRRDPEVIEAHLNELDTLKEENEELKRQVLSSYPLDTVSNAEIASIPDGADDISVKELTVGIEAQQDLHGQESPYPPNGGKNKLPFICATERQVSGITYTPLSDGTVRVNGTYTSGPSYYCITNDSNNINSYAGIVIPAGTTIIGTTGIDGKNLGARYTDGSYVTLTNETAITLEKDLGVVYIGSNENQSNAIFKPMIRLSTEADATFAPYSNICHIYSQAEKNILPPQTLDAVKAVNTSGVWSGNRYTINGVTFTCNLNANGRVETVSTSGTATGVIGFIIYPTTVNTFNGCILNGCPLGGSSATYRIQLYDVTASSGYDDAGLGVAIGAPNGNNVRILIGIANGYNTNGLEFQPMLRFAANPDPTFVPYGCVARIDARGKNLVDFIARAGSSGGVTYTLNGDDTVNAIGTSNSSYVYVKLASVYLKAGLPYKLSGCSSTAGSGKYGLYIRDGATALAISYSSPTTFTATKTGVFFVELLVFYGYAINETIAPMVTISDADQTFEQGKDRTYFSLSKDIWDQQWEVGTYSSVDGMPGTASKIRSKNMIPILPETRYYYYNGAGYGTEVFFYNVNKEFIYYTAWGNANGSYTTPTDAYYMNIAVATSYGTTYNGDIAILNAPPEIWGGELNVTTGELTVTHDDDTLGTTGWTYSGTPPVFRRTVSTMKSSNNAFCEAYKTVPYTDSYTAMPDMSIKFGGTGNQVIYVNDSRYTTSEAFVAAVADTKIVYELATPQVFNLDPVDVKTWLATNNITANTGDIVKLNYRADTALYVEKKLSSLS